MNDAAELPKRCHCGWTLPANMHLDKFAPTWTAGDFKIPRPPDELEVVINVDCPHCGCGFSKEMKMILTGAPLAMTGTEVFKA